MSEIFKIIAAHMLSSSVNYDESKICTLKLFIPSLMLYVT